MHTTHSAIHVGVVIPCYRVRNQIIKVINRIGPEITKIICVIDCCPEGSGQLILEQCSDHRVEVIFNDKNLGVGGATISGIRAALAHGCQIIVKLDGDGQMDPRDIPRLLAPILAQRADFTKGNRFYDLDGLQSMPWIRLVGNALLSFISKFSTGYWHVFDPTNGFFAMHAITARQLPWSKISQDYFFESDLLFRLNIVSAVIEDVPMKAHYGDEVSSLRIRSIIGIFLFRHFRNVLKRIFYNYFLRDFCIVSIELVVGLLLLFGGVWWGVMEWLASIATGIPRTAGTVLLAVMPILLGVQFILAFLNYDMSRTPKIPLQIRLIDWDHTK
ncbi:MAG: glycosyltransferase family 2 protein [Magnetococcales bacterium]|nr:glycosyltransferase family 2 protein [Magnetococcales bacterium]NGZ05930.1 glycosyltransferase family 2 protein [Magnetococcales bacterium]